MKNDTYVIVARRWTYAGLFMVTLATLMYEIILTRIFSVTMWYHYAFMAISVALFGMTVGALLVYLLPSYFTPDRTRYFLALSALLFAVCIVFSFLTHLSIPFVWDFSIVGLYALALTYVVISIPFIFSGICTCLALTKFKSQVSKLYAADLAGAALGCILVIFTLDVTDGPTTVFVIASLASVGALFFVIDAGHKGLLRIALVLSLLLSSFSVVHTILVAKQFPLLRLLWVKGNIEDHPLYEKWNSFSRITVSGNPNSPSIPFGWGINPAAYTPDRRVRQLNLRIDARAGTVLTAFNGSDLQNLDYLKYDVTNVAHYLRQNSTVLVVGAGGGRDILSALVFGQKSIVGVEINKDIVEAVNGRFGDFTGHLDKQPAITFVIDEARSYIARHGDKFDIIQISLTDTWAATSAGAFVLSENSIYTVEAWKTFLGHLTSNGILTVSRWYSPTMVGETYRLTSLATASLRELGIEDTRKHIVIVSCLPPSYQDGAVGVATILVSKEPFSDQDLNTLEKIAREMQFDVVLSPRYSFDSTLVTVASSVDIATVTAGIPLDISPPTDDRPFFFYMDRLRDIFNGCDFLLMFC